MSEVLKRFNQKNIKIKEGVINQRVDSGFNAVVNMFSDVLGERCIGVEKDLLRKKLLFKGFHYITELDLKYIIENRLWERSFNLDLRSEIPTNENFQEIGDCLFEVQTKGSFRIKSLTWNCVRGNLNDEEKARYLDRLNHPLITERIKALDLTRIHLEHHAGSERWVITCQSMVGSGRP